MKLPFCLAVLLGLPLMLPAQQVSHTTIDDKGWPPNLGYHETPPPVSKEGFEGILYYMVYEQKDSIDIQKLNNLALLVPSGLEDYYIGGKDFAKDKIVVSNKKYSYNIIFDLDRNEILSFADFHAKILTDTFANNIEGAEFAFIYPIQDTLAIMGIPCQRMETAKKDGTFHIHYFTTGFPMVKRPQHLDPKHILYSKAYSLRNDYDLLTYSKLVDDKGRTHYKIRVLYKVVPKKLTRKIFEVPDKERVPISSMRG